ncbi:MAG: MoaD/ThiS family protein [Myxococcota bacterium]
MPTVELPSALRAHAGNQARVQVSAATVAEALEGACRIHPRLRAMLFLPSGQLRRTIGVFVGEDDVRDALAQPLGPRDVVAVITAMAGG